MLGFIFFNYYNEINNQYINSIEVTILLILFFNVGIKRNFDQSSLLLLITIFQIIAIVLVNLNNVVDTPIDSTFYRFNGLYYTIQDWGDLSKLIDVADWGYVTFVGFFYELFGSQTGEIIIIGVKILLHVWTCKFIFLIVADLFNVKNARIVTLLWGLNLGATYWITSFLKENLFCFVVTCAVFCLYKYQRVSWKDNKLVYLILFFFSLLCTALFREIFPLFFIMTFMSFTLIPKIVNKYFGLICIFAVLASYFATDFIVYFVPNAAGGFIQREEFYGNSMMMAVLNVINPLISPYPALNINTNQIANIQISAFASYNIVFAYFIIMGAYYVIKNKLNKMYPLIMVLLLNSVMLISYGFSMNFRYIYITTPIAYILIPYGLHNYCKLKLLVPYVFFVISLTLLYNVR